MTAADFRRATGLDPAPSITLDGAEYFRRPDGAWVLPATRRNARTLVFVPSSFTRTLDAILLAQLTATA